MSDQQREIEIIQRAQEDIRYFEELYQMYFPKIFRYAFRKTSSNDLAEDLTQQTFLQAIQAFNSYHNQGKPFGAWLFKIAHNLIVNEYAKRTAVPLEEAESHSVNGEAEIIEAVDTSIDLEHVKKCLSELPPNYQEVVELKKEGLKNAEIADVLEKTESAVKVAFFRAVNMLKECLEAFLTGIKE